MLKPDKLPLLMLDRDIWREALQLTGSRLNEWIDLGRKAYLSTETISELM